MFACHADQTPPGFPLCEDACLLCVGLGLVRVHVIFVASSEFPCSVGLGAARGGVLCLIIAGGSVLCRGLGQVI